MCVSVCVVSACQYVPLLTSGPNSLVRAASVLELTLGVKGATPNWAIALVHNTESRLRGHHPVFSYIRVTWLPGLPFGISVLPASFRTLHFAFQAARSPASFNNTYVVRVGDNMCDNMWGCTSHVRTHMSHAL